MRKSLIFLAMASALAVALVVAGGSVAGTDPDSDTDGVLNLVDNCINTPNSATTSGFLVGQCDFDADGFGNTCDGDFNNNALVNAQDSSILNSCFVQAAGAGGDPSGLTFAGVACENADLNCNNLVNAQDSAAFNLLFVAGAAGLGPSGLPCATLDGSSGNLIGRHPCTYDPSPND